MLQLIEADDDEEVWLILIALAFEVTDANEYSYLGIQNLLTII